MASSECRSQLSFLCDLTFDIRYLVVARSCVGDSESSSHGDEPRGDDLGCRVFLAVNHRSAGTGPAETSGTESATANQLPTGMNPVGDDLGCRVFLAVNHRSAGTGPRRRRHRVGGDGPAETSGTEEINLRGAMARSCTVCPLRLALFQEGAYALLRIGRPCVLDHGLAGNVVSGGPIQQ